MGAPLPVVAIDLSGHLTPEALNAKLAIARESILNTSDRLGLLVNCLSMTGYELGARHSFVEFNREYRLRVTGVAIVTSNGLWRVVVSAMALATAQKMMAFADEDDARRWLGTLD